MKTQQEPSAQEVLAGLVERVTFHNAENGFCVLRVKARGHRDLVTVIGHAAIISAGEWITASGEWVNDRTHGQQFKARLPAHLGADLDRRHREVPRLRHDPRHRPGLRQEAGARRSARRCSTSSRPSPTGCARSTGIGAGARQAHHRRLGRAEDRPGDHGVPAQPWRRHGAGGADLQDLWRRRHPGHDREPLSAGARHPRHRLQDRRRDRHEARHREDRDDPGPRRDLLCADRGHGRGPLRPADRGAGAARRGAARGADRNWSRPRSISNWPRAR